MKINAGGAVWALSVDTVALAVSLDGPRVLLVRRADPPFAGCWALPGVNVAVGETTEQAARRALLERAGVEPGHLEQLYTFTEPSASGQPRDPRGPTAAVAYVALLPLDHQPEPRLGPGVDRAGWVGLDEVGDLGGLAFDHGRILAYALGRVADKLEWTPLVFRVLPTHFTLAELRRVLDAFGVEILGNDRNYQRAANLRWSIEPVAGERRSDGGRGRPRQVFRYAGRPTVPGPPAWISHALGPEK